MDLKNIIREDCCINLKESKKTEVLIEMIDKISRSDAQIDSENLKKEIFYREQLMSTGIGMGIAIPHVRLKGVETPIVGVGINEKGIVDYESIDHENVTIVIMIIVGADQHREHIRLLSQIMGKLKDSTIKETLIQAKTSKDIYSLLVGDQG